MSAVSAERLSQVVKAALETDGSELTAFLDNNCGADSALRAEVESLLAFHRADNNLMAGAAYQEMAELLAARTCELQPGEELGDYEVVNLIGEGGMGEVYLARDNSLGREVAIKLLKPGLGTPNIIRRFREEERLLGGLVHPNIAQLFTGGVTANALPFFVMEYVDGPRLDDYCRARFDNSDSIRATLVLFRKVCSAVSYAHQHVVIHRDIKPANIRVTAAGEPKLLDFGIAKLVDPAAAPAEATITFAAVMTPEYASPEQLRGDTVTTATDIYSLGVVLYELLTGEKPYKLDKRNPAAIARSITDTEPSKPSVAAAKSRNSDSETQKLLRRDLDYIVLKAIRKEPERRYQTVQQFSDDIGRYLEGHPVTARKGTARYRAAKFISRHKAGVAAAVLVLFAVGSGMIMTMWQARIARIERSKAERRFNDVRHLADSFMFDIHDALQNVAGATPARRLLVSRALQYLDSLAAEARNDSTLQRELATAYRKLGDIQGNPYVPNVGDTAGAYQSYKKAFAIYDTLAATHPGPDAQNELAITYRGLGDILDQRGDVAGSVDSYRKSLGIFQSLATANPHDRQLTEELARAYDALGDGLRKTERLQERMECFRHEAQTWQRLLVEESSNRRLQRSAAVSLMKLGDGWRDNQQEAIESLRKSLAIAHALAASDPGNARAQRDFALISYRLGEVLDQTGDYAAALQELPKPLAIYEQLAAADPNDLQARFDAASIHADIADAFLNVGDVPHAATEGATAISMFEKLVNADSGNMVYLRNMALAYKGLGKAHAAAATADAAGDPKQMEHWTKARELYSKAAEAFDKIVKKSTLRAGDGNQPVEIALAIADCDKNIARLQHRSELTN